MSDKKKFLVIMLAFVVLIAGALALYNSLGRMAAPRNIIVHEAQAEPEPTEAPEPEPTEAPEPESTEAPEAETPAETNEAHDHEGHTHDAPETIPAPDARVYDRAGTETSLSSFFDKPTVLNFWASWCGPCQSEMPDFQAKYEELGDQVNFVMVNVTDGDWETVESASAFIDQNGFTFPVFYDTSSEAAVTYEAYSLPTTYFINARGHIVAQAVGAIDASILQQGIDLISA